MCSMLPVLLTWELHINTFLARMSIASPHNKSGKAEMALHIFALLIEVIGMFNQVTGSK